MNHAFLDVKINCSAKDEGLGAKRPNLSPKTHQNGPQIFVDAGVEKNYNHDKKYTPLNFLKYVSDEARSFFVQFAIKFRPLNHIIVSTFIPLQGKTSLVSKNMIVWGKKRQHWIFMEKRVLSLAKVICLTIPSSASWHALLFCCLSCIRKKKVASMTNLWKRFN